MTDTTKAYTESPSSLDPIDLGTAIQKLSGLGMFPDTIAMVLDKPVALVTEVITRQPSPEDKELADEVRRLCLTAIRRAFFMMDYGTGEERMKIVLACVNGSARMLQAAAAASGQEIKTDFVRLMGQMRDVPVRETVITAESGPIDVEAFTAPE